MDEEEERIHSLRLRRRMEQAVRCHNLRLHLRRLDWIRRRRKELVEEVLIRLRHSLRRQMKQVVRCRILLRRRKK